MVKAPTKSTGTSRFRLVVLEAEVADGDISQLTQAITNALRGPSSPSVQRIAAANGPKVILQEPSEDEQEPEADDEIELDAAPKVSKARAKRGLPPTPSVIDLNLDKDIALASYTAKAGKVETHSSRFLLIAGWLKECRNIDLMTVDHVYTCYRSLGWPTNMKDFGQPLRALKQAQLFGLPEKGHYAINHIGLQRVKKLLAGGE